MDDRQVDAGDGDAGAGDDDDGDKVLPLLEYSVTERVRIVGAQPAGELMADIDPGASAASPGPSQSRAGVDPVRPVPADLSQTAILPGAGTGAEADVLSGVGTGAGSDRRAATGVPDLPDWTDPPTGQVPAILDRGGNEPDDPWSAVLGGGPAWREQPHEWDDMVFEPSLLGDAETRLGAIGEQEEDDRDSMQPTTPVGAGGIEDSDGGPLRASGGGTGGPQRADELDQLPGNAAEPRSGRSVRRRRNVPAAIATGLGFAAVALLCLHFGPVPTLVMVTVVVFVAAAEAYGSIRQAGYRPATLLGLIATAAVVLAAYARGVGALPLVTVVMVISTMLWYLFRVGRGSPLRGMGSTILVFAWVGLLGSYGALLITPTLFPDRHGIAFLFGAIAAVAADDVGALAVGGWLGRHTLAPAISPHKTWEGAAGGAVLAVAISVLLVGHIHPWTPGKAAILGVVAAIVAPLGDLCQSMVKRELGVKDMGSALPGHGGLLDRFDGLLFVLPATFYLVRVVHLG